MKKILFSFLLLSFLFSCSSDGTDEAAVRSLNISWGNAFNAGDAKAIAALYSEDAVILPPELASIKGRVAIEEFFINEIAVSKKASVKFHIDPKSEVSLSNNMAWESGVYTATINDSVVEAGKFLAIFQKKNGKWEFIRDIWNADEPATPPDGKK
ncbi:MAG: DUF4440 domain-containing protein [Betaproteobacteria bacterium]